MDRVLLKFGFIIKKMVGRKLLCNFVKLDCFLFYFKFFVIIFLEILIKVLLLEVLWLLVLDNVDDLKFIGFYFFLIDLGFIFMVVRNMLIYFMLVK